MSNGRMQLFVMYALSAEHGLSESPDIRSSATGSSGEQVSKLTVAAAAAGGRPLVCCRAAGAGRRPCLLLRVASDALLLEGLKLKESCVLVALESCLNATMCLGHHSVPRLDGECACCKVTQQSAAFDVSLVTFRCQGIVSSVGSLCSISSAASQKSDLNIRICYI